MRSPEPESGRLVVFFKAVLKLMREPHRVYWGNVFHHPNQGQGEIYAEDNDGFGSGDMDLASFRPELQEGVRERWTPPDPVVAKLVVHPGDDDLNG